MYTLLIADDEVDERALILFLLKQFPDSFHILEASNGREALSILQRSRVDILLSDIQMPFLNGIELATEAKKLYPDTEILFFSGYDDFEYVKNALSLRAVNYILKPVSPEEFSKSLNEIVKRLDSQNIEFTQSEEYIETRFRDDFAQPQDKLPENDASAAADTLLLRSIELAIKLKQPDKLVSQVRELLHKYRDTPSVSHIYIRYICTTLLQLLMEAGPQQTEEDFQTAAREIYILRHFSDIIDLIERFLKMAEASIRQELDAPNYAVHQVKQYVHMHYSEDLSLNLLADLVYLNPKYLSNIFTQSTGCNLNKYIRRVRMEKACGLLLDTNMKVSDISQAVGYPNPSYFCKTFQEMYGTTPERFRQGNERICFQEE